ncbi:hypothetical protein DEM34_15900 [Spiribacter halobius]|uniref:Resolvase/invertase-type recombinase catalytic domain-containing protein n=2 Tax=Sediminicurvatus halobius TaxID=2182432 RepID=A0A2U2MXB8_9GAMM|nr:hypothetical protein DEM34_15900 [Spiribacter halobius]
MIAVAKSTECPFTRVYCLDTSRFARSSLDAKIYKHQLRKLGIEVVFKSLPKTDSYLDSLIESMLEAMDEFHSLKCKEDGLRGMRFNIQRGWRAGGRAPTGYRIEREVIGTREGQPITKTRLVRDPLMFPKIQCYLRGRLRGQSRATLRRELELPLQQSTMFNIEENALVYAGHLVWNRHAEIVDGSYVGKTRMRPRSEWVIHENAHEAMITTGEAEQIMALREASRRTPKRSNTASARRCR